MGPPRIDQATAAQRGTWPFPIVARRCALLATPSATRPTSGSTFHQHPPAEILPCSTAPPDPWLDAPPETGSTTSVRPMRMEWATSPQPPIPVCSASCGRRPNNALGPISRPSWSVSATSEGDSTIPPALPIPVRALSSAPVIAPANCRIGPLLAWEALPIAFPPSAFLHARSHHRSRLWGAPTSEAASTVHRASYPRAAKSRRTMSIPPLTIAATFSKKMNCGRTTSAMRSASM